MKRFISKSISRSGESESEENTSSQNAYEKRRAQVRKAQRKHRDRKAIYLKALEHEVVNLRADNQVRKEEISFLRQFLQDRNISPPPWPRLSHQQVTSQSEDVVKVPQTQSEFPPSTEQSTLTMTVTKASGTGKPLHVEFPQGPYSLGAGLTIDSTDTNMEGLALTRNSGVTSTTQSIRSPAYLNSSNVYLDLSVNQNGVSAALEAPEETSTQDAIDFFIGIDWVLALEHPCMSHLSMTSEPYGTHSHMTSHQLLSSAPSSLSTSSTHSSTWQVPSTNINQLLALSKSFQLQGELTPVQAWYRLKSDPRFGRVVQRQLDMLRGVLMDDVKCYGFGAVIDEDLWMLAVEEILSPTA